MQLETCSFTRTTRSYEQVNFINAIHSKRNKSSLKQGHTEWGRRNEGVDHTCPSRILELFSSLFYLQLYWIVISVHKNSWLVPGGNCTHNTLAMTVMIILSFFSPSPSPVMAAVVDTWKREGKKRRKRSQTLASPSLPHSQILVQPFLPLLLLFQLQLLHFCSSLLLLLLLLLKCSLHLLTNTGYNPVCWVAETGKEVEVEEKKGFTDPTVNWNIQ